MMEDVSILGRVALENEVGKIETFTLGKVIWKDGDGRPRISYTLSEESVPGPTGPAGEAGTKWFHGAEVNRPPVSSQLVTCHIEGARIGDYYLNTIDASLFNCVAEDAWECIGDFKGGEATGGYFNCAEPLLVPHGGLKEGTTFDYVPVTDVLYDILYPYVPPKVNASITKPRNGEILEAGEVVTVSEVQISAYKGSKKITKIELFQKGAEAPVFTQAEGVEEGVTIEVPIANVVSSEGSLSFTAVVTDETGNTVSADTGSFTFVYPYYYGAINADAENPDIQSLSKLVQLKQDTKITFSFVNQCAIFCYPASYGDLSDILDPNGFNITPTFNKGYIDVARTSGETVKYVVYKSKSASTVDGYKVSFSY